MNMGVDYPHICSFSLFGIVLVLSATATNEDENDCENENDLSFPC